MALDRIIPSLLLVSRPLSVELRASRRQHCAGAALRAVDELTANIDMLPCRLRNLLEILARLPGGKVCSAWKSAVSTRFS